MSESSQPAQVGSNAGLGLEPERADDEWTTAVWESWCDMPREGQSLKWHDLLMYGEACYAKAVAAERERLALLAESRTDGWCSLTAAEIRAGSIGA